MDAEPLPISVQAQVADHIRHAILSGHFTPGQRLVEANLCRTLAVSRGPVREALRQLEAERLVQIRPNRGPVVTELHWIEAAQIYHVRALLEGEAASLAAAAATPTDIAAMRHALDAFDAAVAPANAVAQVDTTARFYDGLLQASGNAVIEEMLKGLHARINLLRSRSMSRPGRAVHSAKEMRAILDAIARRDAAAARKAAAAHVQAACDAAYFVMTQHQRSA